MKIITRSTLAILKIPTVVRITATKNRHQVNLYEFSSHSFFFIITAEKNMTEATVTTLSQQFQSILPSIMSIFDCSETEAKTHLDPVFESLQSLDARHVHVANPSELEHATESKRSLLAPLVRFLFVLFDTDSTSSEQRQTAQHEFMDTLDSLQDGIPFAITDPKDPQTKWYVIESNATDHDIHSDLSLAKEVLETTHCNNSSSSNSGSSTTAT
jgi:hypothetical protein